MLLTVIITIIVLSLSQGISAKHLTLRQRVVDFVEAWTHSDKISEGMDDMPPPIEDDAFQPSFKPSRMPTRVPTTPTMAPTMVPTVAPTLFPTSLTCASNYSYVLDSPTPAPTDSICGCCSRVATRNVTFTSVSTEEGVTTTTVVVSQTFED